MQILIKIIAIFFLISLIFDFELILSIFGLSLLHLKKGLLSTISDYIHLKNLKLFYIYLMRIFLLENIRYLLEMFS